MLAAVTSRSSSVSASTSTCPVRSRSRAVTAGAPARTVSQVTADTAWGVCGVSSRTTFESRIGVSGWSRIGDSASGTPCTNTVEAYCVRPAAGVAGVPTVTADPAARARASPTGPMVPSAVESKVEQYFW